MKAWSQKPWPKAKVAKLRRLRRKGLTWARCGKALGVCAERARQQAVRHGFSKARKYTWRAPAAPRVEPTRVVVVNHSHEPQRLFDRTDGNGHAFLECWCGYREVVTRRPDPHPSRPVTYVGADGTKRKRWLTVDMDGPARQGMQRPRGHGKGIPRVGRKKPGSPRSAATPKNTAPSSRSTAA